MISSEYLAGVIDSDGSISITKRHVKRPKPNYAIMIQLGWVKKPETELVMQKLVEKYGGSFCEIEPSTKQFCKRMQLKYCAFGEAAEKILKDIKPHLMLKEKQAENALRVRELTANAFGARSDTVSNELETLWIANKEINDKNGKLK